MKYQRISFKNATDMTEQSHKKDCDINQIMRKFVKTGNIDHLRAHGEQYGDVSPMDYREAMSIIADSNTMFEELPAETRKFFHNDPAEFMEFTENQDNHPKLVELGLATKRPSSVDPKGKPPAATKKSDEKGAKATSPGETASDAKASGKEV